MREPKRKPTCEEVERLAVFYAWDELDASERAAVEAHAQQCPACSASLVRELRLRQAIATVEPAADQLDPSGLLLARCRSELPEILDDASEASDRASGWSVFRPVNWFVRFSMGHPAWSAALLVLMGVTLGAVVPQWYRSQMIDKREITGMTVSASRLSDQDLQTMGIAGIQWVPDSGSGAPRVELHLVSEKPLVVQGAPEDAEVKRVLTYVVQNGQRFDPGVRLDSLEVLRTRSSDADVRRALCAAARKDLNPGVRLKALEALRGFEQDDLVRQALLDALANDANPGVRVEAVNGLMGSLRALTERGVPLEDARLINVFRERMRRDSNSYVRMQSAAAVRQLGPREVY